MWVAQWVKHPGLGHDLSQGPESCIGLHAQCSLRVPLPLLLPLLTITLTCAHFLSQMGISLMWINK